MSCKTLILTAAVLAGSLLTAFLVPGCGSSSSDPAAPIPTGALRLVITGLPLGTSPQIVVAGQRSFVRTVSTGGVVDGIPAGDCTVTAHAVVVAPEDTFKAVLVEQTVTIADKDTTTLDISYESVVTGAFAMRVFHGPLVFQGARYNDSWVPLAEYGRAPTLSSEIDEFSLPYPAGYVIDGCTIAGTDVTETGIAIATSIAGQFGSGSAEAELVVNSSTSVTLTASAAGSASASTAYVGNGASAGVLNLGYPGGNRLYDLSLDIANPDGTPFDLVFTWSYSGGVANTDYAIWHQRFVYQIDPVVCGTNPLPTELYWGRDFIGPASDSGTQTITLSGTHHLIGLGMWTEASGNWAMDFLGRGGSGSASCTGSVTITIEK